MKRSLPALLALVLSLQGCTAARLHEVPRPAAMPAASRAATAPAAAAPARAQASAPARQQAARKAPRRAVWQDIATMPPAPPPSAYQALPVPQPSPMPAPPMPSSFPAQCGPAGCAAPDGTRLQGQGATMLDPAGRLCVQGPVTVQCY